MPSGINAQKARQSRKKEGYYKNQFLVTGRNKVRRKLKRDARAKKWAAIKSAQQKQLDAVG